MRKLWIMAALLPQMALAQVFTQVSVQEVQGSQPGDVRMAGLSGDGRYALVTSMSNRGLTRVSLSDGQRVTLTEAEGAGIAPVISPDGQMVMHCADTFGPDHLRRTAVDVMDVAAGHTERVVQPARELTAYSLQGTLAEVVADGQATRRRVGKAAGAAAERATVTCSDLRLQVTRDGRTVTLTPNGDGDDVTYIWASLSPDGQRILYHVSTEGTYVCDLNGDNVQYVAFDCLAPQWYDDNTIVGMRERDDDLRIASSAIVAYTLDGARQQLTPDDDVLLFPFCSAPAGRIVCTRGNGQMVVINVSK